MTDFESTERRTMNENTDPASITFHNKPITRRLPDGQPLDKNSWREYWKPTLFSRIIYLGRDVDHSMPRDSDLDFPSNPTRAQIVEVYEAAYSELLELLRDTHKEVERARERVRRLESDVNYLRKREADLTGDLDREIDRFEALMELVAIANRADHDGETEL